MNIQINKKSEATVRQQLGAQIWMLIATKELKGGDLLPSVRALGRRLSIHHNTVSQVYGDLVRDGYLVRHRGARVAVRTLDLPDPKRDGKDLDDLINDAIVMAGRAGYTLQDFRRHVLERFSKDLPGHVLVVAAESLFGDLLQAELAEVLTCRIQSCLIDELALNPGMAAGAVVVSHPSLMPKLMGLIEKGQALVALQYNDTRDHLKLIGQLSRPSLIALVSVSRYVLESANLVFSPVVGGKHSIGEYVVTVGAPLSVGAADVIVCDSLVYRGLTVRDKKKVVPYRIVSIGSVERIKSMMHQELPGRIVTG